MKSRWNGLTGEEYAQAEREYRREGDRRARAIGYPPPSLRGRDWWRPWAHVRLEPSSWFIGFYVRRDDNLVRVRICLVPAIELELSWYRR